MASHGTGSSIKAWSAGGKLIELASRDGADKLPIIPFGFTTVHNLASSILVERRMLQNMEPLSESAT